MSAMRLNQVRAAFDTPFLGSSAARRCKRQPSSVPRCCVTMIVGVNVGDYADFCGSGSAREEIRGDGENALRFATTRYNVVDAVSQQMFINPGADRIASGIRGGAPSNSLVGMSPATQTCRRGRQLSDIPCHRFNGIGRNAHWRCPAFRIGME